MESNKNTLKAVSEIKLKILEKYLFPWATILGSANHTLRYVDCYAGGGSYLSESGDREIDGSPLIAIKELRDFAKKNNNRLVELLFFEQNKKQVGSLEAQIEELKEELQGIPKSNLKIGCHGGDCRKLILELLNSEHHPPTFYNIDPYGYPPNLATMNEILAKPKSEIFLTFMSSTFQRAVVNWKAEESIDAMFGDSEWRNQGFDEVYKYEREKKFLDYCLERFKAKYIVSFRIMYAPNENKGERTKYYLIHLSNHPKAVLLMKDIMLGLGDEPRSLEFGNQQQQKLFSEVPPIEELEKELLKRYLGKSSQISFDNIRIETYELPFGEKNYRQLLLGMEKNGKVEIKRDSSARDGLKKNDLITFLGERDE